MRTDNSSLRRASTLLLAHGVITAAAGVCLIVAPATIPRVVDIPIPGNAFLLSYLIAAAEFGYSWLSLWGARSADASVVRGVFLACLIFHAASGVLEIVALLRGVSPRLGLNVAARILIIILFVHFLPKRQGVSN